ncbi:MAG: hypothetical protein IKW96_06410 [Ruminococcus sp.]|uniref:hypothetical protein n=1 Tax=Ruminococcus sp. TaxID=41978 RepID=UPI0025E7006E|nr:hypothetical protein [Ruminococcus sp.]MBR5682895.1 hypothetical protein [Ruminococcus sp.]
MKKALISAVLAFAAVFTTGCASGRIHEKSYLRAASVTGSGEKAAVFALFGEEKTVSGIGADIDRAKSDAELKNGRELFTGYTELIIVDGNECRELLGHMLNKWKVSPSCKVVYCENGGELLEKYSAEQLIGISEQAVKQGIAPECGVITVLGELCENGSASVAELCADGTAESHVIY